MFLNSVFSYFIPYSVKDIVIPTVIEYKEYRTRIKDLSGNGNVVKDNSTHMQIFKKLGTNRALSLVDLALEVQKNHPLHAHSLLIAFEIKDDKAYFFFANLQQIYVQENLVSFEMEEKYYEQDFSKISYLITLYAFSTQSIILMPIAKKQDSKHKQHYDYFINRINSFALEKQLSCYVLAEDESRNIFKRTKIVESSFNHIRRNLSIAVLFIAPMLTSHILLLNYENKIRNEITPKIQKEEEKANTLKNELVVQAGKIAEADSFLKQNLRVCYEY